MSKARRVETVSVEEYLAGERDADVRHEFVDGELFAMAGASRAHGTAVANLSRELGVRLRGGPCRIGIADMKVRAAPGSRYYYPDIVVSCNDPADEPDPYTETRPSLIVEVLSPSTESTDRREKRVVYQRMESLRDYVLVNPAKREIEVYSRDADGWSHRRTSEHETLALASIGVELPAADVFEGVETDAS